MISENNQQIKPTVLRQARKAQKMTQVELGQMLGIDNSDLSKIERGEVIPDWLIKSIKVNQFLAKAGYTFDDLIFSLPDPED